MTTAVNTITARAAALLNDLGYIHWTAAELVDWLNEGQLAKVKINPLANAVVANLQLVAGAKQAIPSDGIALIELRRNVSGAAITPCDRTVLDQMFPSWMATPTADAVQHFMPDQQPETFYVYPAQSATPASVVINYSAVPATVAAGGNIALDDIYAENLVNYILYRAFSKNSEVGGPERASAFYALFKG